MSSGLDTPDELEVSLTNKDVQKLVQEIDEGKIVLPDFQRDFVWPTGQVGSLLESLLNGYYINTLLTLPVTGGGDNVPFPPRAVEASSGAIADSGQLEMVLDGQQRITSIHYALTAPDLALDNTKYPQLFGLSFSDVILGALEDDTIQWKSTHYGIWDDLQPDDYATQIEKDFIPFTIFRSKDSFDDWRYGMEDYANETDEISVDDVRAFDRQTRVFRNYGIPIIEMKAGTSPATVVQTFERINTQGLELGIFDILTARLYPKGVQLRNLWADALATNSDIKEYADTTDEKRLRKHLLKALALYRDKECKDESVGELSGTQFEDDWDTTVQMVNRALEKAQSASAGGFGVTEKYGFPYSTLLPPLANLLHLAENSETYPRHESLEMVQRWYWASTFSRRYSGSSDTISYKDYTEGRDWIRGERTEVPEAIQDASTVIPVELDLSSLTRGGPYSGIMSLLVLNDARDFGTFESITVHEVDDHHIFPDAKLKNGATGTKYGKTARNQILNRTVIESQNNRFNIRDRLPRDYIPDMIDAHPRGEAGIKDLLQGHFINEDGFEALLSDDYERFCQARKEELRNEIEHRIGASVDWAVSEEMV
ncbi:GmrSD restriction endonuclease domain-containing protein [Haloferax volcanii]|uniref:GmrSD restriction endonuclease domain-containing protein n=1 Tax=Haloferax volcanii TaxID=2246 RepID=UPI003D30190D